MATSNPSPTDTSDAITEAVPQQTAEPTTEQAESPPERGGLFDSILVVLLLAFVFLVSSSPIRNSDFWFHLGVGRALSEGNYSFGTDPFRYTTEGVYWANHSWLFDWGVYQLHRAVGGAGLVVGKAVLLTLLGLLMFLVKRPGNVGWAVFCTTLAFLAMSHRLLFQPMAVSFVLLGATLWLLCRPAEGEPVDDPPASKFVPVLLLFVLWVNVDSWFLLGPVLVALLWVGSRLQSVLPGEATPLPRCIPVWLVPASFAVCLLNPHHVYAFSLPMEVSPSFVEFVSSHDARFERMFASPWVLGLEYWPIQRIDLAQWAYFALIVVGLASFLLGSRDPSGWRLLVWFSFALLGAWQIRLLPFFAVVAAPISVLQIQDYIRRRTTGPASARPSALGLVGRTLGVLVGLGLLLLTWAGWLHGYHQNGRRVAWELQPDPSAVRFAETLKSWREQGKLGPNDRGFFFHPDLANYCAWFCPEEKAFLDYRLTLSPKALQEYRTVCKDLGPTLFEEMIDPETGGVKVNLSEGWQDIFRERGITYLVLYDPSMNRTFPVFSRLARISREWTLLHLDGRAGLFGWNRTPVDRSGWAWKKLRFDPARLAFGPQNEASKATLPSAPDAGASRSPGSWSFVEHLTRVDKPSPWETPMASLLLRYFEDTLPEARIESQTRIWAVYAGGVFGSALTPQSRWTDLIVRAKYMGFFLDELADQPPALPLLAVRAARSAIAADPNDLGAYVRLGQAYMILRDRTVERSGAVRFPPLSMARHIQIATVLNQALVLEPDLYAVHQSLSQLYLERQYLDMALVHRQEMYRIRREQGGLSLESEEAHQQQLKILEVEIDQMEGEILRRKHQFSIDSAPLTRDPVAKAKLAIRSGLPRLALEEVLLKAPVVLMGVPGAKLQLELFLMLGRVAEAKTMLDAAVLQANKQQWGHLEFTGIDPSGKKSIYYYPAFDWLLFCQAAAVGDYELATKTLTQMYEEVEGFQNSELATARAGLLHYLVGEIGARATRGSYSLGIAMIENRLRFSKMASEIPHQKGKQVNLLVLLGMMNLERGTPGKARPQFEKALELAKLAKRSQEPTSGLPLAYAYSRWIESASKIEK